MSLLNGGIASIMTKAFAGIYLPATLRQRDLDYDDGGSPTASESAYPCRAQVDSATEAMRQSPGYTEKTVRVLVLKNTLGTSPTSDDVIEVGGQRYNLTSVLTDPANSYYDMAAERA